MLSIHLFFIFYIIFNFRLSNWMNQKISMNKINKSIRIALSIIYTTRQIPWQRWVLLLNVRWDGAECSKQLILYVFATLIMCINIYNKHLLWVPITKSREIFLYLEYELVHYCHNISRERWHIFQCFFIFIMTGDIPLVFRIYIN